MRKAHIVAAFATVTLCSAIAFGKSGSFVGGNMKVTGTASAPSAGACSGVTFAANCPTAPNTAESCACVQVSNATVTGAAIGKGTANLSFDEDAGDGDGTDGSITPSNCEPVFGSGGFIDSKTAAQATVNIVATLCGSSLSGGYSALAPEGTAWGTVSGTVGGTVALSFKPR